MDNEKILERIKEIKKSATRYFSNIHCLKAIDLEVLTNYFDEIIDLFKEEGDDNETD